jgi:putative phosphoesterase
MTTQVPAEAVTANVVAVLADCHIHPGGGPEFPPAVLDALAGVDLIVTLGDMGEAAGLDQLSAIAPVLGVHGADDSDDPRTAPGLRLLTLDGRRLGCVFDATSAGLATASDPFSPASDLGARMEELFGGAIDILLHASTHRPEATRIGRLQVVNPGSAVLPSDGSPRAFARLTVTDGAVEAEIVTA